MVLVIIIALYVINFISYNSRIDHYAKVVEYSIYVCYSATCVRHASVLDKGDCE